MPSKIFPAVFYIKNKFFHVPFRAENGRKGRQTWHPEVGK